MRNYRSKFIDEDGKSIDGSKITGFLHTCRKMILTYCFICMKNIVKGDKYIDFFSQNYGKERAHLKCYDFSGEGQWLGIKSYLYKRTWIVRLFTNQTRGELV